jgi:hypothetical protein
LKIISIPVFEMVLIPLVKMLFLFLSHGETVFIPLLWRGCIYPPCEVAVFIPLLWSRAVVF